MGDLLQIQPNELKFRFELKKNVPVMMTLTNPGSERVAFKVNNSPWKALIGCVQVFGAFLALCSLFRSICLGLACRSTQSSLSYQRGGKLLCVDALSLCQLLPFPRPSSRAFSVEDHYKCPSMNTTWPHLSQWEVRSESFAWPFTTRPIEIWNVQVFFVICR